MISLVVEGLITDSPILRSLTLSPSTPVVLFDDAFAKYVANFSGLIGGMENTVFSHASRFLTH